MYDMMLSGVALAALSTVVLVQVRFTTPANADKKSMHAHHGMSETLKPLSWRIIATLCGGIVLQTVVFGFSAVSIVATVLLGSVKAMSRCCMFVLSEWVSWTVIPSVWTFALMCTSAYSPQRSRLGACLHIISCFLSLHQLPRTMPMSFSSRTKLWMLSVIALAPYSATQWLIFSTRYGVVTEHYQLNHPVELLVRESNAGHEAFRLKQSQTYDAALKEYGRRYGLDPPAGFEAWYNFAKRHKSVVIDDFDTMYDGIAPFWRLSGREYDDVMNRLKQSPDNELWARGFSGPHHDANCVHAWRTFDRHVGELLDTVPLDVRQGLTNVSFLFNHLDEPRVVLPSSTSSDGPRNAPSVRLINLKHQAAWGKIAESCVRGEGQRRAAGRDWLPLVSNRTASLDLCRHDDYESMHGLFQRPTSLVVMEGLAPVLSTGAPSTMGDILFPSPAYAEREFQYTEADDWDWEQKKNNLYWAGSTTGGHAGKNWHRFHRQRFVNFIQNSSRRLFFHLREHQGSFTRVASSFLDARLYDVMFTKVFQCDRRYCREQDMDFNIRPWVGRDEAFRSRLVFDMDGNGISGRFYKLLASKSVPLKQTLLREWHDGRLAPWVHYVPVSQHMEELPELVSFLASTKLGRQRAREIADQGREWASRALREVDFAIYLYRLMLELARLQDVHREKLASS